MDDVEDLDDKGTDIYGRLSLRAENRVGRKFEKAGVIPFPEVSSKQAAKIIGCRKMDILWALRNAKLRGRRVHGGYLIRIVDLFYFAVSRELEK